MQLHLFQNINHHCIFSTQDLKGTCISIASLDHNFGRVNETLANFLFFAQIMPDLLDSNILLMVVFRLQSLIVQDQDYQQDVARTLRRSLQPTRQPPRPPQPTRCPRWPSKWQPSGPFLRCAGHWIVNFKFDWPKYNFLIH